MDLSFFGKVTELEKNWQWVRPVRKTLQVERMKRREMTAMSISPGKEAETLIPYLYPFLS